jgi:hypothetical protein
VEEVHGGRVSQHVWGDDLVLQGRAAVARGLGVFGDKQRDCVAAKGSVAAGWEQRAVGIAVAVAHPRSALNLKHRAAIETKVAARRSEINYDLCRNTWRQSAVAKFHGAAVATVTGIGFDMPWA